MSKAKKAAKVFEDIEPKAAKIFDNIELKWRDQEFTISADRVLEAIGKVEEVITLHELAVITRKGSVPMARVAQAYGALLRFAGCQVTDEKVYESITKDDMAVTAATILMIIMLPPPMRKTKEK